MDKYGSVDQNPYSPDKDNRREAEIILKELKEVEKLYKKFRTIIVEKTQYGGIRKRYVKENNQL